MIYGCSQPRELWFNGFNHVPIYMYMYLQHYQSVKVKLDSTQHPGLASAPGLLHSHASVCTCTVCTLHVLYVHYMYRYIHVREKSTS